MTTCERVGQRQRRQQDFLPRTSKCTTSVHGSAFRSPAPGFVGWGSNNRRYRGEGGYFFCYAIERSTHHPPLKIRLEHRSAAMMLSSHKVRTSLERGVNRVNSFVVVSTPLRVLSLKPTCYTLRARDVQCWKYGLGPRKIMVGLF